MVVVVDDGASVAAALNVVGEDGASAPAASDQKTLQPADPFQYYLHKTNPHVLYRWIVATGLAFFNALRIHYVQGFYFATYYWVYTWIIEELRNSKFGEELTLDRGVWRSRIRIES
ncbi:putative ribosome-binding factor A, chloroplastic-like [Capsicum annuum]|nr:putative ribosome-binding factor A, chloroplastic-like [Capsicum annuum]